jgi:hypothetical protein
MTGEDIRAFLKLLEAYVADQVAHGYARTSLRSLLHVDIIAALPHIARKYSIDIPTGEAALAPGEAEVTAWDDACMSVLRHKAEVTGTAKSLTLEQLHEKLRVDLRWDATQDSFDDTFSLFVTAWEAALKKYSAQRRLTTDGQASSKTVKFLTKLLYPEGFKTLVEVAVLENNVRTVDNWFNTVVSLEREYDAILVQRRSMRSAGRTPIASSSAQGHTAPVKASGHRFVATPAVHSSGPRPQDVSRTGGGSGGPGSGGRIFSGSPIECYHCKGNHKVLKCPTLTKDQRLAKFGEMTSGGKGPSSTGGSGKRVNAIDTKVTGQDGVFHMGSASIPFIFDTGASDTFISLKNAMKATAQDTESLVALKRPFPVRTAAQGDSGVLMATHKLEKDVDIEFFDGAIKPVPKLRMYVVPGLTNEAILLGKSTTDARFKVNMTKILQAALSTSDGTEACDDPEDGTCARAAVEDEDNMPLPVKDHDPILVGQLVNKAVDAMSDNQFPSELVEEMREFVTTEVADMFRISICNDPPARVAPIELEMDMDAVHKLRMPAQRKMTAMQSEFTARVIARLLRNGFVKHAPYATVASPAYPVNKHNVDPKADIEEQMHLVVDSRAVNSCTRPTVAPIPDQALLTQFVAGAKYFGKLDFNNGFFQLALAESSKRYMNIVTDRGVYESQRLLQGSRNATGPFHAAVAQVLEDYIGVSCLLYIDDVLIYAKSAREFVEAWKAILKALHAAGFKVHAKKTVFFAREVLFCGRLYSEHGVRFNPDFINSVLHMSTPVTVDQLRTYLASANWMRGGIARFAELAAPLNDILTLGLSKCKRPTQRAAQKISLVDIGWNQVHDEAMSTLNQAIAADVLLACPDHSMIMCMYTDASDLHWAGIVTQCAPEELEKPPLEQHHFPLAFVSGSFDDTQKKWPTIEKEGFAIKTTTVKCAHLLHHPRGFKIFTDHANLGYLFNPNPAIASGRRQAADRIERWLISMRAYNYDIQHIRGVDNVASDMLSRWATPLTDSTIKEPLSAIVLAATTSPSTGITPETILMFDVDDAPTESEIKTAQEQTVRDGDWKVSDYNVNDEGLLVDKQRGRIVVPDRRHL